MSYKLPPADHPIRSLIDMQQLASLGSYENRLRVPSLPQAKASARAMFSDKAARHVHMIAVRASGDLCLMRFGRKGGHRQLWKFGPI